MFISILSTMIGSFGPLAAVPSAQLALTPVAAPISSPPPVPSSADPVRSLPPGFAVITRGSSTNSAGFSIVVPPTGEATVRLGTLTRPVQLDTPSATQLYADLERAGRLDKLPAGHCMKSASFGTTTSIAYRGRNSPDLQCAQNSAERALQADVDAISSQAMRGFPQRRRTLPVFRRPAPESSAAPPG